MKNQTGCRQADALGPQPNLALPVRHDSRDVPVSGGVLNSKNAALQSLARAGHIVTYPFPRVIPGIALRRMLGAESAVCIMIQLQNQVAGISHQLDLCLSVEMAIGARIVAQVRSPRCPQRTQVVGTRQSHIRPQSPAIPLFVDTSGHQLWHV